MVIAALFVSVITASGGQSPQGRLTASEATFDQPTAAGAPASVISLVRFTRLQRGAEPGASPLVERGGYVLPNYDELPAAVRDATPRDWYDRLRNDAAVKLERIVYVSDGLRIHGFLARPSAQNGRLPVIVFCRPGVGETAAIGVLNLNDFYEMQKYAAAGFLVVASQFRGVGGSDGRDEVGGADVDDIANLLPVIRGLPEADPARIALWGESRGAQMALQALRAGFPARTMAGVGIPTDWGAMIERSPQALELAKASWPDFEHRRAAHIEQRSAVRWIDDIHVPLLIFQGGDDVPVPADVTLEFARRLALAHRPFELVLYAGDDHLAMAHRDERIVRTIEWFRKHLEDPIVHVTARDYAFDMPATVPSGRVVLEMRNEGTEPHYLRLMRIEGQRGLADVRQWRQSRMPPPAWLRPAGGLATLAPGTTGAYVATLEPGSYAVFCGHPSPDGVQHVDKGMLTVITATAPAHGHGVQVSAAVNVRITESGFAPLPRVAAGEQWWHVANASDATHQAMIVRLPDGIAADADLAWFRNGSKGVRPGRPVGGVLEIPNRSEADARVTLAPGRYMLICTISDPGGRRHFDAGEAVEFTVRAP